MCGLHGIPHGSPLVENIMMAIIIISQSPQWKQTDRAKKSKTAEGIFGAATGNSMHMAS